MLPTERGLRYSGARNRQRLALHASRRESCRDGVETDRFVRCEDCTRTTDWRSRVDVPAVLLFLQNVHAALFADCRAIEAETRPSMVIFAAQRNHRCRGEDRYLGST